MTWHQRELDGRCIILVAMILLFLVHMDLKV